MSEPTPEGGRFYAPIAVTRRRLSVWRWIVPFVLIALGLRLIPIAAGEIADLRGERPGQAAPVSIVNLMEKSGETFPGSAYFYAENAFEPDAAATNGLPDRWRGNSHILAIDIGPPAAPYRFVGQTATDRVRALSCLTNAIYYEAANEPEEGQRAVAQVVLNRLRSPDWPNTVCGVVYQGTERDDLRCQFTFSCDGSMARTPVGEKWFRARRVAEAALQGQVFEPAGLATYYHTLTVFPAWATQMRASAIIGAHIFYRAPGAKGLPGGFRDSYAGIETINGPSANAYLDPRSNPPLIPAVPVVIPATAGLPAAPGPMVMPASPVTMPAPAPASPSRALIQSGDVKPEYLGSGRPLAKPRLTPSAPAPAPSPHDGP